MNRPTPHYDELSKKVRAAITTGNYDGLPELKWKNARLIEFDKKYPNWKEYLKPEDILFMIEVEYQKSLSDIPHVRRTYTMYFTELVRDIGYWDSKDDKDRKERKELIRQADEFRYEYGRIRNIIAEANRRNKNYSLCGCIKCNQEYPAYRFVKTTPFLCHHCRFSIRLRKRIRND